MLAKDTHGSTIRLAPPLVVTADELDWAVDQLAEVLAELSSTCVGCERSEERVRKALP